MASSKHTQSPRLPHLMSVIARQRRERMPSAAIEQTALNTRLEPARSRRSLGFLRGLGAALRDLGDARAGMLLSGDEDQRRS